jgi:hypothetical protein
MRGLQQIHLEIGCELSCARRQRASFELENAHFLKKQAQNAHIQSNPCPETTFSACIEEIRF